MTPSFTPQFTVTANDNNITTTIEPLLISLTVHDEVGLSSDSVEIVLDDSNGSIVLPSFGALLAVAIGYKESGLIAKGQWRVDELDIDAGPEHRLLIRARSADTNSADALPEIKALKDQSWVGQTIGQIASVIAGNANLTLAISPEIASVIPYTDQQTRQSDLAFLMDICHYNNHDTVVRPANGVLVIATFGSGLSVGGQPLPTFTITPPDSLRCRCVLSQRGAFKKVSAATTDDNGVTTYQTAMSPDADEDDADTLLPDGYPDPSSALNAAQAAVNNYDRATEKLELSLVGNAAISSGCFLTLTGFRTGVDNTWVASHVTHKIDDQGFVTDIEAVKKIG